MSALTEPTTDSWCEVSMADFYRVIGPQNVIVGEPTGPWPYSCDYRTPAGEVRGKSIGFERSPGLSGKRYYLPSSSSAAAPRTGDRS